jgi:ATP-dependent DNA helicase RecG
MPRSHTAAHADGLQDFLERIARPIEFACRDAFAHLQTLTNLETFVSAQVIAALAARTYPRSIESNLLALRSLFVDFHAGLTPEQQRERLKQAKALIAGIKAGGSTDQYRQDGAGDPTINGAPAVQKTNSLHAGRPLWDFPIQFAKGVGPKRALLLQRLRVETAEDALWNVPWRFEDRSRIVPIRELTPGMMATVCGLAVAVTATRSRVRRMSVLEAVIDDGTGRLQIVLFNQPYMEDVIKTGARLLLVGRIAGGPQGWLNLRMDVTHCESIGEGIETTLHAGRIVPIYHETKGWSSRQMRVLVRGLLDEFQGDCTEVLPVRIRAGHRLLPIQQALEHTHFPPPGADIASLDKGLSPAQRRLAFEELFLLQTAMAIRQRHVKEEQKTMRFDPRTPLLNRLSRLLPFRLTASQQRVFGEIQADMVSSKPMNRLLQGDVGSGKTMVALHAIVMACGSGCQAAFMVPTEILAAQHFVNLKPILEALGLGAVLITSGKRPKGRAKILQDLQTGAAHVAIGTHALIQQDVRFANLGLAVIDEQHKFGVLQRKTLMDKGYRPDVLVMTATPIPRTLAMTVYGDLDVSVIDALPPGRKPVRTWLFADGQRGRAWQIVRDELRARRQAYFVYPLVEESEKVDLKAAIQAADRLQRQDFPDYQVGLLHGKMPTADKERTMAAFKAGEIQILVATTVIEVGVDVPNATVMVIEHAERFGLAQLHQLRGRVGRSAHQSYCLLMSAGGYRPKVGTRQFTLGERDVPLAQQRLAAMVKSNDGFVMAEEDLRIRGPGEWFGLRQWGLPEFRAADLIRDADLLQQARRAAFSLVEEDPHLSAPHHRVLKAAMLRRWQAKLALGSVS